MFHVEGKITFKREMKSDTSTNYYFVKGDNIKLDNGSKKRGKVEGSFLFDLKAKTIKFTNPARKVWGESKSETPAQIKGKCEVTKTKNTKTIAGKKCTEYVVKNTDENTTISFWISTDKFDFFVPMVKLWNRKDKSAVYFNQITDLPKGAMPMLSIQSNISDGKVIDKLEVTVIEKKTINLADLQVPADYKKFEQ